MPLFFVLKKGGFSLTHVEGSDQKPFRRTFKICNVFLSKVRYV